MFKDEDYDIYESSDIFQKSVYTAKLILDWFTYTHRCVLVNFFGRWGLAWYHALWFYYLPVFFYKPLSRLYELVSNYKHFLSTLFLAIYLTYNYTFFFKLIFTNNASKGYMIFLRNSSNYLAIALLLGIHLSCNSYSRSIFFNNDVIRFLSYALIALIVISSYSQKFTWLSAVTTSFLLSHLLILKSSSLLEFLLFLEIITYNLLLLVYLYKSQVGDPIDNKSTFLIFFLNFFGTYGVYFFILNNLYITGDLSLLSLNNPYLMATLLSFKLGAGPWFLWNSALYNSLPTTILNQYIISSLFIIIPTFYFILFFFNKSFLVLSLFLFMSISFFLKKIIKPTYLNNFLLISSFCSILLLTTVFVLL